MFCHNLKILLTVKSSSLSPSLITPGSASPATWDDIWWELRKAPSPSVATSLSLFLPFFTAIRQQYQCDVRQLSILIPMGCMLLRDVYVRNCSTNIPAISVFIGVAIVTASQHVSASRGHHQESTI
jgi:hypothetical protein